MTRAARLALALIVSASCVGSEEPREVAGPSDLTETLERGGACDLPRQHLLRIRRGYHPQRSGDVQIVPKEPHVVAEWLSHAGPWGYVQRVPLFLYGPGHVPAVGRVERAVTVADLAPTLGELVGFAFDAPDGRPLREALPEVERPPPRLVLTVIWDSAGRNVLAEHPDAWPTLRGLIPNGVWFERATVGSAPSTTPAVHGTIGTGAFPRRHGLVDLRFRLDGEIAWIGDERPTLQLLPTLADRYSASTAQRAEIGLVASLGTLGLIGHGASVEGGGHHLVAMHDDGRWTIGDAYADHFRFPAYVNEVGGLEEALRSLDLEDGVVDGSWMGERVLDDPEDVSFTPAWSAHQTRVLQEIIRREGFGADDVPDLLYANYKQIDAVGHRWTMNSPQMEAVVRASDTSLRTLIGVLDREVGEGEWVIALTADHGSVPDPALTGASVIAIRELARDVDQAFSPEDGSVVEQARPTQLWIDEAALREGGHTLEDVATFVAEYRLGQNVADPDELTQEQRDAPLFSAAFPSSALLEEDPCVRDP